MLLKNQSAADTDIVVDRDNHSIVLTRTLAAPRDVVFDAWTQPEHVRCWWDPAGKPLAECEIDLRPGGAFKFLPQPSAAGPQHAFAGIYREIAPPDCLVFEAMGAIGRILFASIGDRTHLTVRIECGSAALLEQYLKLGIDTGTALTLDNLVTYIGSIRG